MDEKKIMVCITDLSLKQNKPFLIDGNNKIKNVPVEVEHWTYENYVGFLSLNNIHMDDEYNRTDFDDIYDTYSTLLIVMINHKLIVDNPIKDGSFIAMQIFYGEPNPEDMKLQIKELAKHGAEKVIKAYEESEI